ncbi:MAG: hypothetical protein AAF086_02200 [Planctomycetota bacterium]
MGAALFFTVLCLVESAPANAALSSAPGGQIVGFIGASGPNDLMVEGPIVPPPFPQDSATITLSPETLMESAVVEFQVGVSALGGSAPLLLTFINQTNQSLESIDLILGTTTDSGEFLPGGGPVFSTEPPSINPSDIGDPAVVLAESYAIGLIGLEDASTFLTLFFFGDSGLLLPNESFELAIQITPIAVPEPGVAVGVVLGLGILTMWRSSRRIE